MKNIIGILRLTAIGLILSFLVAASPANSGNVSLNLPDVSSLLVFAEEATDANANIILIVGGSGLRNGDGLSKNYLVKEKATFFGANLNYYLLPNWNSSEKLGYPKRADAKRVSQILSLIKAIGERNPKPIWLIGFSRGSVDAGHFAKAHPEMIEGIVLISGVYENESKKARAYGMEKIIGTSISTKVLITHHAEDACMVTKPREAVKFFQKLRAPVKEFLTYSGGEATGRDCGPLNHHGFEGMEGKVAKDIALWITVNSEGL